MSKVEIVEIVCPDCGEVFKAQYWESLNVDLDPGQKERIFSGEFFRATCPKCKNVHPLIYPMLYHDMENLAMVFLVLNDKQAEGTKKMIFQSISISGLGKLSPTMSTEYRYRLVFNPNELREKAVIFDCGLDDRVIEVYKAGILYQLMKDKYPEVKVTNMYFDSGATQEFVVFEEGGIFGTIDFSKEVYDEIKKSRKNVIEEKSKDCFIIDIEWARNLLKNDGVYNEKLPLQDVHFGLEYFGFSDGKSENICLCLCQKQSIENRVKIFMRYYQYNSCVNSRNEMLLSFLGLPKYFQEKIKKSRIPFGEEWLSFLQYSRDICHICNAQNPEYRHSFYIYDSGFKQQWGHYMKSRYFHYGFDEMEFWGVYFIEEALTDHHRKMLCPTKEELADELGGFQNELDRLFSLPKDEFETILYYRSKAKILRKKGINSYEYLPAYRNFDEDFKDALHKVIHKRFLAVRKEVRDELKSMIPKTKTPPAAKGKN